MKQITKEIKHIFLFLISSLILFSCKKNTTDLNINGGLNSKDSLPSSSKLNGKRTISPVFYVWNLAWNSDVDALPNVNCINFVGNSFATLSTDGNGNYSLDYSASGNWQASSNATSYTLWNNFTRAHPNTKILMTFGGGNNSLARTTIINADKATLQKVANVIINDVKSYYLQGVDLNIEGWWDHTNAENITFANNLITFVHYLRVGLPGYIIMVSAGVTSPGQIGTVTVGAYDGTMLNFYNSQSAITDIDYLNIEAYQTGINNFYDVSSCDSVFAVWSRTNFPTNKILFGFQSQDNGSAPYYAASEITSLANKVVANGLGGMSYWGRGYGNYGVGIYSPYYMQAAVLGMGLNWQ